MNDIESEKRSNAACLDMIAKRNPLVREFFEQQKEGPLLNLYRGLLFRHILKKNYASDIFRVLIFDANYLTFLTRRKIKNSSATIKRGAQMLLIGTMATLCISGSDNQIPDEEADEQHVEAGDRDRCNDGITIPLNDLRFLEEETRNSLEKAIDCNEGDIQSNSSPDEIDFYKDGKTPEDGIC